MEDKQLDILAKQIRLDILKMWGINLAPLSGALSITDLYIVLFFRTLDMDEWANDPTRRARILPKTTAANALYATLKYAGLLQTETDDGQQIFYPPIVHKHKWAGDLDGTLTRNFGQAIGLAFYAKYNHHDNDVIAFISEGDLQAGVDHLAKLAAAWKLNNLTVVLDCNGVQSSNNVTISDPSLEMDAKGTYPRLRSIWENYGWRYVEIDGHNFGEIEEAFSRISSHDTPYIIVAKTTKGKGVPLIEQDPVRFSHHLSGGELADVVSHLEQELKVALEHEPGLKIKPARLKPVTQRPESTLHVPRIEYGTDDTPSYVLRNWLSRLRDDNPDNVFILNTDNATPFDRDIPVYSPDVKSQHLQLGVNEKLALNVARGIANAGGFPIYTTPATHLQVVAEDLFHCALAKDPVLLVGIFAGVDLAFWGPSHTSSRDILLFSFPGVSIFQPATADDMRLILTGIYENPHKYLPGYIRLPSLPFMKISGTGFRWSNFQNAFENGFYWFDNDLPGEVDVLFVASGISVKECLTAAAELERHRIKCTVVNILNLRQVDGRILTDLSNSPKLIVSVIDADPSVMTNLLWEHLPPNLRHKITTLGITGFSESSYSKAHVLSTYGINAESLVNRVLQQVTRRPLAEQGASGYKVSDLDTRIKKLPPSIHTLIKKIDKAARRDKKPIAAKARSSKEVRDTDIMLNRSEEEARGYCEALEYIFANYRDIEITEDTICSLHEQIFRYVESGRRHRGTYRYSESKVETRDRDGRLLRILVEALPPQQIPAAMNNLVNWLHTVRDDNTYHPLLVISAFLIEFLKIHPFFDGSGRTSRALTDLLLLQAGYGAESYFPHEKIMEDDKETYYVSLSKSQKTFGTDDESILIWTEYFLNVILRQTTEAAAIRSGMSALPQ